MRNWKWIAAALLLMIVFAGSAYAAQEAAEITASGACGSTADDKVLWALDNGTLTVSGKGRMKSFGSASDAPWHAYRTQIQKVVIGDNVTLIGDYSFQDCSNLKSASIGKNVGRIGYRAFGGCVSLTEIRIGERVQIINTYAFDGCGSLERVYLESNINNINAAAFSRCTALTDVYYNGTQAAKEGIYIQGGNEYLRDANWHYAETVSASGTFGDQLTWTLENGTLTVSGSGYMPNYDIDKKAPWYSYHNEIMNVVIEDQVKSIGDYSFRQCRNLTGITVGSGVHTIGSCALWECDRLREARIPDNVTALSSQAFGYCEVLERVYLGSGLMLIDYNAFANDPALSDVYYNANETSRAAVIIGNNNAPLLNANWHYTDEAAPNPTDSGVCGDNLTWTLEDRTLTVSGSGRMTDYASRVDAPWYPYYTIIENVIIEDGVRSVGDNAFRFYISLSDITIGSGVRKIGDYAFMSNDALTEVRIPDGVKTLGWQSFSWCENLKRIYLGNGVNKIEGAAFYGSTALEDVHYNANKSSRAEIDISNYENQNLLSAEWHYTNKDAPAFSDSGICGDGLTWTLANRQLTIGGTGEMADFTAGSAPWDDYSGDIDVVSFGDGVESIGSYAFYDMDKLTFVTIGSNVKSIGFCAYASCDQIREVRIPDSVTQIESQAFGFDPRLERVYLGSGVTFIAERAFDSKVLTDVHYNANEESRAAISIGDNNAALLNANWHYTDEYAPGMLVVGEDCGDGLFWQLKGGTLTITGTGEMYNYWQSGRSRAPWYNSRSAVTRVEIGNEVHNLGAYAFANLENLTEVTFGDHMRYIEEGAFSGCRSLTGIELTNRVQGIGASAFANCSRLTSVSLSGPLLYINQSAFSGDTALRSVYYPGTEDGKASIRIEQGNDDLLNAEWTCELDLSGTCGENMTWTLKDGVLTISGGRHMDEWTSEWDIPWRPYKNSIHTINIGDGITTLSNNAFNATAVSSVNLGNTLMRIPISAFQSCNNLTEIYIPDSVSVIAGSAFSFCHNLRSIRLGTGMEQICSSAFYNCESLTDVYYSGTKQKSDMVVPNGNDPLLNAEWHQEDNLNGTCGEKLTWTLENGTLTISGTGAMDEWKTPELVPWNKYVSSIRTVKFDCSGLTSIGWNAFVNCTKLYSIDLPESIRRISHAAFMNCTSLKSVVLPEMLLELGGNVFNNCAGLTGIVIPDRVPTIPGGTFYRCYNMESITLGASVKAIGDRAFDYCTHLKDIYFNGIAEDMDAISYTNEFNGNTALYYAEWHPLVQVGGELSMFSSWSYERGVLTIEGEMQMDDWSSPEDVPWHDYRGRIRKVIISEDILNIGSFAFCDCPYLTSVTLPSHVSTLGTNLFANSSVYSVEILCDKCTILPENTFYGCERLQKVRLPERLQRIDSSAFYGCSALKQIDIPANVSNFGESAFQLCYNLQSLVIPEGVTSIPYRMLLACNGLTEITLPGSLTEIADQAFMSCNALTDVYYNGLEVYRENITIGVNNSAIGIGRATWHYLGISGSCGNDVTYRLTEDGVLTISGTGDMDAYDSEMDQPWYAAHAIINKVILEEGVTSVGNYAFARVTRLREVQLPGSLTTINACAFYGDTYLTKLALGGSIQTIFPYAFFGCNRLADVTYPGTEADREKITIMPNNSALLNLTWNTNGVCGSGVYWTYEDGTLTISGSGSMSDYSTLTPYNGTAPWLMAHRDSITHVVIEPGVQNIGDYAFFMCSYIETVEIPDSVTSIGQYAFYGNYKLANIVLPKNLKTIGDYALANCIVLTNITFPASVTDIGSDAVYGCDKLYSIELKNRDVNVGRNAFIFCDKLSYVYYNGLETEKESLLTRCTETYLDDAAWICEPNGTCGANLTWKLSNGTLTISGTGAMDDYGLVTAFRSAAPWSQYYQLIQRVVVENGVTGIGNNAFFSCSTLTGANIAGSVISIGSDAFSGCYNLTECVLQEGVKTIGSSVFSSCGRLGELVLPQSLESIGSSAFDYCENLTRVTIPANVAEIGRFAFSCCQKLQQVDIMNSAVNISTEAFSGCHRLSDVYLNALPAERDDLLYRCENTGLENATWHCIGDGATLQLPAALSEIESEAFAGIIAEVIVVPAGCQSIAPDAFDGCPNLRYIINHSGVTITPPAGVEVIGD